MFLSLSYEEGGGHSFGLLVSVNLCSIKNSVLHRYANLLIFRFTDVRFSKKTADTDNSINALKMINLV